MKRNYGIDALRMTAMGLVIVLHLVGVGGICGNAPLLGANFLVSQLLRTAAFCAVNVYALISGFVGWSRTPKPSSLLTLWIKVIAFSIAATVFTWLRCPELVGWKDLLRSFLPVTTGQYWYFGAYVGMFFFLPLLNHAVRGISRREAVFAMAGLSLVVMSLVFSQLKSTFQLVNGYSTLWLMILYLAGGLMARFDLPGRLSAGKWAAVYALAVLAGFVPRMVLLWLRPVFWTPENENLAMQYTNPTVVLASVALVCCFSRLELRGSAIRVVKKLSPHCFGVYLAHTHPLIFANCIGGKLAHLGSAPLWEMLTTLLAVTVLIYAIGTALDALFTKALRLTRIDKLLKHPDQAVR